MPLGIGNGRRSADPRARTAADAAHGMEFVSRKHMPLPAPALRHVALWPSGGLRVTVPHTSRATPAAEAPPATTAAPGAPQPAAVPAQTPARPGRQATVAPSGEAPRKPALPEGTKPGPAGRRINRNPAPGVTMDQPGRPMTGRPRKFTSVGPTA